MDLILIVVLLRLPADIQVFKSLTRGMLEWRNTKNVPWVCCCCFTLFCWSYWFSQWQTSQQHKSSQQRSQDQVMGSSVVSRGSTLPQTFPSIHDHLKGCHSVATWWCHVGGQSTSVEVRCSPCPWWENPRMQLIGWFGIDAPWQLVPI